MSRIFTRTLTAAVLALLTGAAWAQSPEVPAEGPDPASNPAAEAPSAPPEAAEAPAEAPGHDPAPSSPGEAPAAPATPPEAAPPTAEATAEPRLSPIALGDDDIHLALRWGMRVHLDPAFDVLGDDRSHLAVDIGLDVRVWRNLAVGLSFTGSGEQGEVYGHDTRWQDNALFLSAVYRHRFHGLGLSAYGRLGPTVHWYRMVIGDDLDADEALDADPWQFGARAAAGLEFFPLSPAYVAGLGRFGVGVVLEGYYDQAFVDSWSSGDVDPGHFDPSGPGWSLGIVSRF